MTNDYIAVAYILCETLKHRCVPALRSGVNSSFHLQKCCFKKYIIRSYATGLGDFTGAGD